MSSQDANAGLDLGRKLTLIEAEINADRQPPTARRLGRRVTVWSAVRGAHAFVEIDAGRLWVWFEPSSGPRLDVTDDYVSDIVALVEQTLER